MILLYFLPYHPTLLNGLISLLGSFNLRGVQAIHDMERKKVEVLREKLKEKQKSEIDYENTDFDLTLKPKSFRIDDLPKGDIQY
jgi:hypothetical protein